MPVDSQLMAATAVGDWHARRQTAFMTHTYCFDFPVNGAKS